MKPPIIPDENLKDYQTNQLWVTHGGVIVELTEINLKSPWGVVGNVIQNLEKSIFYSKDDDWDDGIGWAWEFTGNFDVDRKGLKGLQGNNLVKQITRKDNPEYFI